MRNVTPIGNRNGSLPLRHGKFETIVDGLDYAARGETGCNFFSSRGELVEALGYREIRERAVDLARAFERAGVERGERLAIIAETSPDFLIFFFACQYAGLVPVPLPLSVNLGGREAYVARLRNMMKRADARLAVAGSDLVGYLEQAAKGLRVDLLGAPEDFYGLPSDGGDLRPLGPDEPCYIQYSSGSTSLPRGVLVTQRAIIANARTISEFGLQIRPDDRCATWLPLYHDMGLVGFCLTPALSQVTIDYLASTAFARRPLVWLRILSEYGATVSFSPTFGYELCARVSGRVDAKSFDLSRWRVAGVGGEMVRPSVLRDFAACFADSGFDSAAFVPSYGLAESTLAVSFSPLGSGVQIDRVRREAYVHSAVAIPANGDGTPQNSRAFVKCGGALPGHSIEIRDEHNKALPDRRIGWVCIAGPSLMRGYYEDRDATRSMFTPDGWLNTGDMGYLVDGELVITGRSKDLIICNGRNIWPQDLEWAVESRCGVSPGHVAAFSVDDDDDDRERIVVVLETRARDAETLREFRREVGSVIMAMAGVGGEVVLAPPRTLTFTSSGKLSRAAAKADYLAGTIEDIAGGVAAPSSVEPAVRLAAGAGN
jgi:fatty-acyl-CoA synthase